MNGQLNILNRRAERDTNDLTATDRQWNQFIQMKTNLHHWYYLTGTIRALDMERSNSTRECSLTWLEWVEIMIKAQQESSTGERKSSFKTRLVLIDSLVISSLLLIARLKLKGSTTVRMQTQTSLSICQNPTIEDTELYLRPSALGMRANDITQVPQTQFYLMTHPPYSRQQFYSPLMYFSLLQGMIAAPGKISYSISETLSIYLIISVSIFEASVWHLHLIVTPTLTQNIEASHAKDWISCIFPVALV